MRRFRYLLAGAALAFGALVAPFSPAYAQEHDQPAESSSSEHGDFANHAAEECSHLLAEGKTVEDCQESPNPLLPETGEIVWGGIAFVLVFLGLWKLAVPSIKKTLNDRTERIRASIDEADKLKAEAASTLAQYQASVAEAKAEAARIVDEARAAAETVRADLIARAEAEANEIKAKGREDVEAGKARAITELQAQVGDLTIALAEKVVERSLDDATNRQLIDNYINNLGNQ